jgi:hypothetical protein
MKPYKFTLLIGLLLSGCTWWQTPSNSMSLSVSTSLIPMPNDEFNPSINGRTLLREVTVEETYSRIELEPLPALPLSPINFPVTQDVVTAYALLNTDLGTVENEEITFQTTPPQTHTVLASMAVSQILNEQDTITLLQSLQPSDERFNQLQRTKKDRNLSFQVARNNPYYWFNNYLREEEGIVRRYPNEVMFGEGTIHITFQTNIIINPTYQSQRHGDDTTIYEIYDETYPPGFFGAQDYQYRTPRVPGNLKHALTMGPATLLRDTWRQLKDQQVPTNIPLVNKLSEMTIQLKATKTESDTLTFSLMVVLGDNFNTAKETLEIVATIKQNEWQPVRIQHMLWV